MAQCYRPKHKPNCVMIPIDLAHIREPPSRYYLYLFDSICICLYLYLYIWDTNLIDANLYVYHCLSLSLSLYRCEKARVMQMSTGGPSGAHPEWWQSSLGRESQETAPGTGSWTTWFHDVSWELGNYCESTNFSNNLLTNMTSNCETDASALRSAVSAKILALGAAIGMVAGSVASASAQFFGVRLLRCCGGCSSSWCVFSSSHGWIVKVCHRSPWFTNQKYSKVHWFFWICVHHAVPACWKVLKANNSCVFIPLTGNPISKVIYDS